MKGIGYIFSGPTRHPSPRVGKKLVRTCQRNRLAAASRWKSASPLLDRHRCCVRYDHGDARYAPARCGMLPRHARCPYIPARRPGAATCRRAPPCTTCTRALEPASAGEHGGKSDRRPTANRAFIMAFISYMMARGRFARHPCTHRSYLDPTALTDPLLDPLPGLSSRSPRCSSSRTRPC